MIVHASTSIGSPSRPMGIGCSMVCDERVRLNAPSVFSARRRRDAHSVTMREELESPCFLGRCHDSVPLRGPITGSQVDLAAWNRAGEAAQTPSKTGARLLRMLESEILDHLPIGL